MTRFTVVWHQFAEDELTRLWLDSVDRRSITEAANAIDRELATDPVPKSVVAVDDLYELECAPLRVLFSVSEPDRLVEVYGVKLIRSAEPCS